MELLTMARVTLSHTAARRVIFAARCGVTNFRIKKVTQEKGSWKANEHLKCQEGNQLSHFIHDNSVGQTSKIFEIILVFHEISMENAHPSCLNPIFFLHLTLAPRSIFEAKKNLSPPPLTIFWQFTTAMVCQLLTPTCSSLLDV